MNFIKAVEEIQNREENKGKIVLVKCGIFFVGIGKDAIILNKIFNIKMTCVKRGICRVGIPTNSLIKYIVRLEELGVSYTVYDYIMDIL